MASIALAKLPHPQEVTEVIEAARIAIQRSPGSVMGPNLIIKVDGAEVGRYLLESRVLNVPRPYRRSIDALLRSRGEDPRSSLPSLPLPTGMTCRYEARTDLVRFLVPASAFADTVSDDSEARAIGVARLQRGVGVAIAEEFRELMWHGAAELGFSIDRFLDPEDLPGDFSMGTIENLHWDPETLPPEPPSDRGDYVPPPWIAEYVANRAADRESARRSRLVPPRAVQERLVAVLPPLVKTALEEAWESRRIRGDMAGSREWRLKEGETGNCLTSEHLRHLKKLTPAIPVPKELLESCATLRRAAPSQAPFMLALKLRESHPVWWDALPWKNLSNASRRDGGPATTFKHVARGVVEESGHAEFIRLVSRIGHNWPLVDWPNDLGLNDQMRAWIAVGALAHADLCEVDQAFVSRTCSLCGVDFHLGTQRLPNVLFTESEYLCWPCGQGAMYGVPGDWTDAREDAMPHVLRALAEEVGTAPSLPLLRLGIADGVADRVLACALRSVLPNNTFSGHSTASWLRWLELAGVLESGWRRSRGIISTANDGHQCRSMFERHVDDFFSRNDIPHECEPTWPYHARFNSSGRRRADWLLPGGTLVEAAGMMSRPEYADKMAAKVSLAEDLGVHLIVIEPSDIGRLDEVFSAWL